MAHKILWQHEKAVAYGGFLDGDNVGVSIDKAFYLGGAWAMVKARAQTAANLAACALIDTDENHDPYEVDDLMLDWEERMMKGEVIEFNGHRAWIEAYVPGITPNTCN